MRIHPLVPVPLSLPLRSHIQCTHTCACAHKLCYGRQNGDVYIVLKVQLQSTNRQSPNKRTNDLYIHAHTNTHLVGQALFFFPIRNMKRNIWICAGIKSNGNKSISKRRFNYNIEAKRRENERRGCVEQRNEAESVCVILCENKAQQQ